MQQCTTTIQQIHYNNKGGRNREMFEKEKLDLKGKQTNYFCVHGKENYSRKETKGVGTGRQRKARNREQKDQKII